MIGFTAVKADVPEAMTIKDYRDWIAGYGLAPSLVSAFAARATWLRPGNDPGVMWGALPPLEGYPRAGNNAQAWPGEPRLPRVRRSGAS